MNLRCIVTPLVLIVAAHAVAQSAMTVAQGLADAEARAVLNGDKAWYRKTLAPEYVETTHEGKTRNKAQSIAQMDETRKMGRPTKVVGKVARATMKGDRMTTTTNVSVAGTLKLPDGKGHKIDYHAAMLATWIKRGGAWQKLSEKTLQEHGTIDGKAY